MCTSKIVPLFAGLALLYCQATTDAAALTPIFPPVSDAVTLTYEPSTGNLSYDGNGIDITTMEIKSAEGLFIPENVNSDIIVGPFDVFNTGKFFTLTTAPNQVAAVDIGPVLPTGLSFDAVLADLTVNGSLYPQGNLVTAPGGGPYLLQIPEPNTALLLALGLFGLVRFRSK